MKTEELSLLSGAYGVDVSWLSGGKAEQPDEFRDRVELAARELAGLQDNDLDKIMSLLQSFRGCEKNSGKIDEE